MQNVTLSSILTLKWHRVPKEPTKVHQSLEELRVSYWQHFPIEKNLIIIRNKRYSSDLINYLRANYAPTSDTI